MINFKLSTPKQKSHRRQPSSGKTRGGGFTIIELLIATTVFSVILLLIAEGILQFNAAFYKGVTQSNTQNVARSVLENISQAIQFNGGTVTNTPGSNPNTSYYFCIDNTRYRYLLGDEISSNPTGSQTHHALLMDTPTRCNPGKTIQTINKSSATGTELLDPNMRLSKLSVSKIGNTDLYSVDVRVAYGGDAFLYSPSGNTLGAAAPDATCHANWVGVQFCATAELNTVVEQRIAN